jgi:transcriptional antiterminator RfaH
MDLESREMQPQASTGGELAWYCARTQPKHEHIAAGGLRARLGLEVFSPRLRLERSTQRGLVRVIEPLFPGYIFVRCDLKEKSDAIRHVTGISSLVHFGHQIPRVADDVVEELRQCFELDEPMGVEERLRPGAEVVVSAGPFLGSRGLVVRSMPGRQRVQILLDFLGRTTVAEVERASLAVENRRMADLVPSLAMEPDEGEESESVIAA